MLSFALVCCAAGEHSQPARQLNAEVIQELPHDPTAFTQGLELVGNTLYEGTGLVGESTLRKLDPRTGAERDRVALPEQMFGEGITIVDASIWQLTWQDGVAFRRDRRSLAELERVRFEGEGWGLCYQRSADRLVMSDGSDTLTFRDPRTFEPTGEIRVTERGEPVSELNELECANGSVYANVWQRDSVVRIDPASGAVTETVDLAGLLTEQEQARADVLNGIAAVPGTDQFLVTGKRWPKMFRVRFTQQG